MKQFFNFDRRKKTNIVDQVIEQIISYINDFKLIHGSPLPQIELTSKELLLSKVEVEQILATLTSKEYLKFDPIQRTYLIQKPSKDNEFLITVSPIFREIINRGKTPKVFTLVKSMMTVNADIAFLTGFAIGDRVVHFQRYFTANDVPMMFIDFYLSLDRLPNADQVFLDHEPHLDKMMNRFPTQYKYHVREINIVEAPEFIVKLLAPKESGMICNQGKYRFYNLSGQLIESGLSYLTDLTEFNTTTTDLNLLFI
jgi:DNA-binding GntR family transcriptional regulator